MNITRVISIKLIQLPKGGSAIYRKCTKHPYLLGKTGSNLHAKLLKDKVQVFMMTAAIFDSIDNNSYKYVLLGVFISFFQTGRKIQYTNRQHNKSQADSCILKYYM